MDSTLYYWEAADGTMHWQSQDRAEAEAKRSHFAGNMVLYTVSEITEGHDSLGRTVFEFTSKYHNPGF